MLTNLVNSRIFEYQNDKAMLKTLLTERVKLLIMWAVMLSTLVVPIVQRVIRLIYGI